MLSLLNTLALAYCVHQVIASFFCSLTYLMTQSIVAFWLDILISEQDKLFPSKMTILHCGMRSVCHNVFRLLDVIPVEGLYRQCMKKQPDIFKIMIITMVQPVLELGIQWNKMQTKAAKINVLTSCAYVKITCDSLEFIDNGTSCSSCAEKRASK